MLIVGALASVLMIVSALSWKWAFVDVGEKTVQTGLFSLCTTSADLETCSQVVLSLKFKIARILILVGAFLMTATFLVAMYKDIGNGLIGTLLLVAAAVGGSGVAMYVTARKSLLPDSEIGWGAWGATLGFTIGLVTGMYHVYVFRS